MQITFEAADIPGIKKELTKLCELFGVVTYAPGTQLSHLVEHSGTSRPSKGRKKRLKNPEVAVRNPESEKASESLSESETTTNDQANGPRDVRDSVVSVSDNPPETGSSQTITTPLTLSDVKAALEKYVAKFSLNEARDLLGKFNAERMSGLLESQWGPFIEECNRATAGK